MANEINVQFSDSTGTTIVLAFGCAQDPAVYPNQGTVASTDARWATFYATLPVAMQATLTPPPTPAAPTLAQEAQTALGAGLTITLSGTLTLTATVFPTDAVTTGKIGAVATTINTTGGFPGGATSYPMKDSTGAWHTFTVNQYKTVAGAIAAYVAALDLIIDGNPLGATALPAANADLSV